MDPSLEDEYSRPVMPSLKDERWLDGIRDRLARERAEREATDAERRHRDLDAAEAGELDDEEAQSWGLDDTHFNER